MRTRRRRWVIPAVVCGLVLAPALGWGVLGEVPGRQIVLGAVTQPWQSNVVFRALPPNSYASWDSAGFVKIVVTLAADSLGPNESVFRTETRAVATDAASRAKFRRYWSVFSPGILLIRTQALSLVRREAERRERSGERRDQPSRYGRATDNTKYGTASAAVVRW